MLQNQPTPPPPPPTPLQLQEQGSKLNKEDEKLHNAQVKKETEIRENVKAIYSKFVISLPYRHKRLHFLNFFFFVFCALEQCL